MSTHSPSKENTSSKSQTSDLLSTAPENLRTRLESLTQSFLTVSKENALRPGDMIRFNRGLEALEALLEGSKGSLGSPKQHYNKTNSAVWSGQDGASSVTASENSYELISSPETADIHSQANGGSLKAGDYTLNTANTPLHVSNVPTRAITSSLWTEDTLQTILDSLSGLAEDLKHREEEATHLQALYQTFVSEKDGEIKQLKTLIDGTMQAFVDMEQQNQAELRYLRNKVDALETTALGVTVLGATAPEVRSTPRSKADTLWEEPSLIRDELAGGPGSGDELAARSTRTNANTPRAAGKPCRTEVIGIPARTTSLQGTSCSATTSNGGTASGNTARNLQTLQAPPPYVLSEADPQVFEMSPTHSVPSPVKTSTPTTKSSPGFKRFRRDALTVQKEMEKRTRRMKEMNSELRSTGS